MDSSSSSDYSSTISRLVSGGFRKQTRVPVCSCDLEAKRWAASASAATASTNKGLVPIDPSSLSNFSEVRVTKFHLHLFVDFSKCSLEGFAEFDIEKLCDDAKELVLDTNHLIIDSVVDPKTSTPLSYQLELPHETFGSALRITLIPGIDKIRVFYSTSPVSSAIQWLPPASTAGKKYPFLFTQCQAIHARSLMPCQDSPANKTPYTATIIVPSQLKAVMSALPLGDPNGQLSSDGLRRTHSFSQPIPIPSYLTALAVGALERRRVGPRSHVYAEAETIDAATFEFSETEQFLSTAEELCGPYLWGQYDMLLLPPSFPYGGMENPNLTFLTPTLLAGDRSLAMVVAHEIAHSWTGNSVTSATWEHFFLNEGFTVFIERKIAKKLHGKPSADLDATSGLKSLNDCIERYGAEHDYTTLHVKLDGVDPDDAFSSIPYEKGFNLLMYLEQVVGGEEKMNKFLKSYCTHFALSTVTTHEFQQYFIEYFKNDEVASKSITEQVNWKLWLDTAGYLPIPPKFDDSLVKQSIELGNLLKTTNGKGGPTELKEWRTNQLITLLEHLQELQNADLKDLKDIADINKQLLIWEEIVMNMENRYHFTSTNNSEVLHRILLLAIRSKLLDIKVSDTEILHKKLSDDNNTPYRCFFDALIRFITAQGRMKFIRPLYRDLFQKGSKQGSGVGPAVDLARAIFAKYSTMYHGIAQKMIARDLLLVK